jgi:hypothetical protein
VQDGYAETTVRVDVWVVERSDELEVWSGLVYDHGSIYGVGTGWAIGVVLGERELGFEVATVVEGIWVQHDKGHTPFEDVFVDELQRSTGCSLRHCYRERASSPHLDVGPRLLAQRLELVHEQPLRRLCHVF